MQLGTLSANKIAGNNIPFSAEDYSRFKFGCKDIARKFGYELADHVCEYLDPEDLKQQIVVCSSAYNFIPTASYAMKDYFVQRLNYWLVEDNLPVIQETKITRTIFYTEDYGSMSVEQRAELLKDDIRVTGSHEKLMQRMITEHKLDCDWIFAYYARIADDEMDPKFEDYLNYYYVKDLLCLDSIIKNENFLLNTRTVKYILRAPAEQFIPFISYQRRSLISTIYHQAIGNGYHLVDIYKPNLEYIRHKIQIERIL